MDGNDSASLSARRKRTRDQVLAILAQHSSGLTRAGLSRMTGLSASAISDCVASLRSSGLVAESAAGTGGATGRGRRATVISLVNDEGVVVGIDFGHAHVTAAVATTTGELLERRADVLDVDHRPGPVMDVAAELARSCVERSGHTMDDVLGIAAGIPGPLDIRTQVVRPPTILSDWVGLAPAAELARRLGHPVTIGNDADMGARGEQAYGAARGLEDFLYIKASHGIGAGIVIGGRPYRGATGIAGEIGHTQIPDAVNWCRCGSRGCLETVVSITTVRRQLAHVLATHQTALDESAIPPLFELSDNPAAARVLTEAGRTVGRVLADLVNCLNPAALVLGGELGSAGEPFAAGIRESVARYAQPASAQAAEVITGQLGAEAEVRGAVAAAVAATRQRLTAVS
ncbi:ROK family transcriptional regulator [Streptomyces cocklensis]|uniref:Sugar kinase of the NBD/HSP70 family, may contain an N-terminal HTH domain n=1 Tax=Actinacidiphila cocklensis TaxID=887465 RepID=A0A9W4DIF2_9ACTN|nr:ROK family protein [Actinacidiphila cocklensis]MDD1058648.1 ROK family transcriptional regulator [Actinacidiphila cocklensis]WSX75144.1 ROK family transcriptional regulator [Streptomyces sp. NBC_00899]CAG6390832.1 Sugar kinase of the NBD/HSP70 family, may contain an N-terminal HTH domain [Actinacidiphila cocklensis]